jgi:photosystem II stability/assembly factor-like uncharacterized protein
VTSFSIDASSPHVIYVAGAGGVFKSVDGGQSWLRSDSGLPAPNEILLNPVAPNALYALSRNAVFKSTDGAASWKQVGGCPEICTSLALSGRDPSTLLLTSYEGWTIQYSKDAGATWKGTGCGPLASKGLIAWSDPPTFYVRDDHGLCRSQDGGQSWRFGVRRFDARLLGLDPNAPGTLYVSTSVGLRRSTNGGASLEPPVLIGPPLGQFAVDPNAAGHLISVSHAGAFVSLDAGKTWTTVNRGLPEANPTAIQFDPVAPSTAWVAFGDHGLYRITFTGAPEPCATRGAILCLQGNRFSVRVGWSAGGDGSASGQAVPITSNTGAFWFLSPDNLELVVKVLDGRPANGKWWVFYGALSNVEYTLTVTDTETGAVKTYVNPQGQLASVADTAAF